MQVTEAEIAGLLIIQPTLHPDRRGYFYEGVQLKRYAEHGMPAFVQQNCSRSYKNVIRGLHYQLPHAQGKLVGVSRGSVLDVVVDLRRSSPTFGKWFSITLSDINHTQLYVPPGFAHGFCALSDTVDFFYFCTEYYDPTSEYGIAWNDPTLNIAWPTHQPILSEKDQAYPHLANIPHHELFA